MVERTSHYSEEELKTGINIANTRIIETNNKGEQILQVFNSYMEFNRLGDYHGYWNLSDAKSLYEYLGRWLDQQEKDTRQEDFNTV